MAKPVVHDSNTLAAIIQSLGGTIVPAETLRFDLPLASVRDVVPRLNELGVACRKVAEHQGENPTKLFSPQSVATIECYRKPEEKLDRLPEW